MLLTSWRTSSPPRSPDLCALPSLNHSPRSQHFEYRHKNSLYCRTILPPFHSASFARNVRRNRPGQPNHCRSGWSGDLFDSGFVSVSHVCFTTIGDCYTDPIVRLQLAACPKFTVLTRFDALTQYPPLVIAGPFPRSQRFRYCPANSLYC